MQSFSHLTWLTALCFLFASSPALGQEAGDADGDEVAGAAADLGAVAVEEAVAVEKVAVTGSRLKRDAYAGIAPLRIITAEAKREAGLVDAGEILQEASTVSGVQFDLAFEGFVLNDGPGVATANLRGLGANRTLVLLNGRRLAPAGVEGALSAPNLNVVPDLLVRQYDQLLDGASSVYGSDAVAGVVNAVLRKDFDGFAFDYSLSRSDHGAGDGQVLGASWGRSGDRGFIGVGAQHYDQEPVTLADRPWTAGCQRHREIDQNGRVRTRDLFYETRYGMEWDDCRIGSLVGRVAVPVAGSVYYTPRYSNGGWPNFSEPNANWAAGSYGIDGDGNGKTDVGFRDHSLNGRTQFSNLLAKFRSNNVMAYGEYALEGEANLTPYFEALYGASDSFANFGQRRLFPHVPALNPYNICNPEADGGVDCGVAVDMLYANPGYIASFNALYGDICATFGVPATSCGPLAFGLAQGPIGPAASQPILAVRGDRNSVATETTWRRGVVGMRGDLPRLNRGNLADWSFDVSFAYSYNSAVARRPGIRQDRLDYALGYYSENWVPCENTISAETRARRLDSRRNPLVAEFAPDVTRGCVPVNLFAPTLYADVIGDFGTAAERDYLFDSRDFDTNYHQTMLAAHFTGDLFQMPAGPVVAGFGLEYRKDEIESLPDRAARDGLFWGFAADGGARGEKATQAFFGEIELPFVAVKPGVEGVTVNLSARYTDDEYSGGAWTGATKIGWRPTESLLIRGTFGTSYRAPNPRELFLRSQTGFRTVRDPCYVPESALTDGLVPGQTVYDPELDPRDPHVLQRCREEGVDPTIAGGGAFASYSVATGVGGSLTLDEETSASRSFGFAWEQPFTDRFDLTLGMTYYDIEIEQTIIEPTIGHVLYDCYVSRKSAGGFCGRITRDPRTPEDPRIRFVNLAVTNRDNSESVRGVDLNLAFDATLTVFERPVGVRFDFAGHRLIERNTLFVSDTGERTENKSARAWGFVEYKANMNLRLDYDRWRFSWSSRYVGDYREDPDFADPFSSIAAFSSTCLGPPNDLLCKDIETASDYWLHSTSVTYRADAWLIRAGVRNVFDKPPPLVDPSAFWSVTNNVPRGLGYDLDGRKFFLTAKIDFGGGV